MWETRNVFQAAQGNAQRFPQTRQPPQAGFGDHRRFRGNARGAENGAPGALGFGQTFPRKRAEPIASRMARRRPRASIPTGWPAGTGDAAGTSRWLPGFEAGAEK